jgi:hypothetical protein
MNGSWELPPRVAFHPPACRRVVLPPAPGDRAEVEAEDLDGPAAEATDPLPDAEAGRAVHTEHALAIRVDHLRCHLGRGAASIPSARVCSLAVTQRQFTPSPFLFFRNRSPPCRNEPKVPVGSWGTSRASERRPFGAPQPSPRFRPTDSFPRRARAAETNISTVTTVRAWT